MSLIGSLEQFDLANILRRLEVFSKTGLLVVKQGDIWVEFYFRQGQLVCIGPMRANLTLIDRLLQAGLVSSQVMPQVKSLSDALASNETQVALALINEGYLSREILRAWSSQEASQVLHAIFSWPAGKVYFEEDCPTPADRLLVALSISTILDVLPTATPRPASASAPKTDEPIYQPSYPMMSAPTAPPQVGQFSVAQFSGGVPPFAAPAPAPGTFSASQLLEDVPPFATQAPGSFSAAQLIEDFPFSSPSGSLNVAQLVDDAPSPSFTPATSSSTGFLGAELNISGSTQSSLIPPQPVRNPLPPARIDTSFMKPELILVPVDLSSIRDRNPQVQLTPDQWRLFSLIDGHVSLQELCQILMAPAEQVCTLAGELMAIGLVMPQAQFAGAFNDPSMGAREYSMPGMSNSAQMPQIPYANPTPPPARSPQTNTGQFVPPIQTQSQWGNGQNGATFMVGGGWVLSSQQGAPQTGQSNSTYAPVMGMYQ